MCQNDIFYERVDENALTNCADPSMWLDHQLEKDVGCKVFLFVTWWKSWSCLVTKPYDVQTQQLLQELR